eukprot:TRINITY_DN773021_c0_g1_i1.p1 TRINITY_DN773021_c0_g1~~TRINITY_DN773021_c0_g1_i1.p1  ORF type:complete len:506 (+),score=175.71 TRINITY_DN773021_c0_g1_i1:125-1642(+)
MDREGIQAEILERQRVRIEKRKEEIRQGRRSVAKKFKHLSPKKRSKNDATPPIFETYENEAILNEFESDEEPKSEVLEAISPMKSLKDPKHNKDDLYHLMSPAVRASIESEVADIVATERRKLSVKSPAAFEKEDAFANVPARLLAEGDDDNDDGEVIEDMTDIPQENEEEEESKKDDANRPSFMTMLIHDIAALIKILLVTLVGIMGICILSGGIMYFTDPVLVNNVIFGYCDGADCPCGTLPCPVNAICRNNAFISCEEGFDQKGDKCLVPKEMMRGLVKMVHDMEFELQKVAGSFVCRESILMNMFETSEAPVSPELSFEELYDILFEVSDLPLKEFQSMFEKAMIEIVSNNEGLEYTVWTPIHREEDSLHLPSKFIRKPFMCQVELFTKSHICHFAIVGGAVIVGLIVLFLVKKYNKKCEVLKGLYSDALEMIIDQSEASMEDHQWIALDTIKLHIFDEGFEKYWNAAEKKMQKDSRIAMEMRMMSHKRIMHVKWIGEPRQ